MNALVIYAILDLHQNSIKVFFFFFEREKIASKFKVLSEPNSREDDI